MAKFLVVVRDFSIAEWRFARVMHPVQRPSKEEGRDSRRALLDLPVEASFYRFIFG